MAVPIRPEVLSPENLHKLLYACRIVELGLSEEQFAEMVAFQKRMRETGYHGLTVEEAAMCSDLWRRLQEYTKERKPGFEHLADFLQEEVIW